MADDADHKKRKGSWHEVRRHRADLPPPVTIGERAAGRAVDMLGARKVPTCQAPVVFTQEAARSILGLFARTVLGSSVWRKASYLVARVNTEVASDLVTIVDDPFIPRGLGSRPHDGEGLPSRRNVVVEQGVLRTFLCDCYAARKLERGSTSNAARLSSGRVGPTTTNFVLVAGDHLTEKDIIASTSRGLLVVSMMGFGFNPTTGDFSRGAAGFWIEGGQIAYPVSEVTISLNLDTLLKRIDAVANQADLRASTVSPMFRVASMTVGGR